MRIKPSPRIENSVPALVNIDHRLGEIQYRQPASLKLYANIRDVTNPGEIVLDGFMGSGTTILAAERTKRVAYGIELEPGYVDVAIRRWETITGKEAVLADTGQTFAEVAAARSDASDDIPAYAAPEA